MVIVDVLLLHFSSKPFLENSGHLHLRDKMGQYGKERKVLVS